MWWTAVFEPQWTGSVLTPIARPPMRVLDQIDADLVARDPVALVLASRSAEHCPLPWLPYLAAERSVNEFSADWPEARQRAVVAGSFAFHQVQGTRAALDRALTPLGYNLKVVEWFERTPRLRPYTFRIRVQLDMVLGWHRADRDRLWRVANGAKNAHTLLEAIEYRRDIGPAPIYVGGGIRRKRVLRVGQIPRSFVVRTSGLPRIGTFLIRERVLRIAPRP